MIRFEGAKPFLGLMKIAIARLGRLAGFDCGDSGAYGLLFVLDLLDVSLGGVEGYAEESVLGPKLFHEAAVERFGRTGDSRHLSSFCCRFVELFENTELVWAEETHLNAVAPLVMEAAAQPLTERGSGLLEAHAGDALCVDVANLNVRLLIKLFVDSCVAEFAKVVIGLSPHLTFLDHFDICVSILGNERGDLNGQSAGIVLAKEIGEARKERCDEF